MSGRRGQGAMEYLMTYGWAVLVVMIVGIVMWRLGIFNLGGTPATSSGFVKIMPQLSTCRLTTSGNFTCIFTNGAGGYIRINSITASSSGTACATGTVPAGAVGGNENLNVQAWGCIAGTAGDAYSIDVTIDYNLTVANYNIEHNETGKVKGAYESG
ncbi:MAG: hypothetical protein PHG85_05310 [Candidatus Altiarchaeota archaeon]|nr:hypothetical protein [Candidatus Altiarchaeota archaeon]